jgi:hypothetical protein
MCGGPHAISAALPDGFSLRLSPSQFPWLPDPFGSASTVVGMWVGLVTSAILDRAV